MGIFLEMAKNGEKPRWSAVYELNKDNINELVPEEIGNYRLGFIYNGKFCVRYVGRDDTDVHRRLLEHVTAIANGKEPLYYTHFRFVTQTCARNAYLQECEDYHNQNYELDNKIHPAKPDNTDWKCPNQKCEWSK